jgi:transposase-like protein
MNGVRRQNFWNQGETDMSKGIRFSDEFKQDAVAQVVERRCAVSEVAARLEISTKSQ